MRRPVVNGSPMIEIPERLRLGGCTMMSRSRRFLIATTAALAMMFAVPVTGLASSGATDRSAASSMAEPSRERRTMNRRVFDTVWNEVRRHYYDPDLHGLDWRASRDVYRPLALAAPDDRTLYLVLERMLRRKS